MVRFCRDNPEQDVEEIWLAVSDHNTDILTEVAGALDVKATAQPCGCSPQQLEALRSTGALTGTFTFDYQHEARGLLDGHDTSVAVSNAGSVVAGYTEPNPEGDPLSWQTGTMNGSARVSRSYLEHEPNGLSGTLDGQDYVHPAGDEYNSPKSYLSVLEHRCTYGFVVVVGLDAIKTEFKETGDYPVVLRFGVADLPLPEPGQTLSGSMSVPAILSELDVSTGYRAAGFGGKLETLVGAGNMGRAVITWRLEAPPASE